MCVEEHSNGGGDDEDEETEAATRNQQDQHPSLATWRAVSNRFARRVAEAYDGDIERALGDSDAQVVATVAAWE